MLDGISTTHAHTVNCYYVRLVFSPFVCLGVLWLSWPLTTQEYFYVWLQGCQELKSTWGISISSATNKLMYQWLWSASTYYIAQNDQCIHDWRREFALDLGSISIFAHTHTPSLNTVFFYVAGTADHSQWGCPSLQPGQLPLCGGKEQGIDS